MAIDLDNGKIILDENVYDIEEWAVWFMGPGGIYKKVEQAIVATRSMLGPGSDQDPSYLIRPVPVALAEQGKVYEWVS